MKRSLENFDGFQFSCKKKIPLGKSEISSHEISGGFSFPSSYKSFLNKFGCGSFYETPITLVHPALVERLTLDIREILNEHWFWEGNKLGLSQHYILECIACFDSESGDYLLFHPSKPNLILLLEHSGDEIESFGSIGEIFNHYSNCIELEPVEIDEFIVESI